MWKALAFGALAVTIAAGALAASQHRRQVSHHEGSGVVVTAPDRGRVRIRHDAMAGYMPAMTMDLEIRNAGETLVAGDRVRFALRVVAERSWIERVTVTGHGEAVLEPSTRAGVVRLREGDPLPALSLVDQDGASVTNADLEGRLTVLTFIFTRCPVPDFCPLISRRFKQLQSVLGEHQSLPEDVRLLSISIDPAFDTPPVLAAYARSIQADPQRWRLAGGDPVAVQQLARAFSVYVERNGALLDHTLATAVVDRRGRVAAIWRGNGWTVDEVTAALRRVGRPADQ
jgi:protein SCO1/2